MVKQERAVRTRRALVTAAADSFSGYRRSGDASGDRSVGTPQE